MDYDAVLDDGKAYQAMVIKTMKESVLEENIRKACKYFNLLRYHTYRSTKSPSGFPDDVIVGKWVMYRELKRHNQYPSVTQAEWIARLKAAGADVDVWRPQDWMSGRITKELADCAGVIRPEYLP